MHYAILAAGEGSRLDMVATKPLATIQGRTLVGRLLDIIAERPGVGNVVVVTNSRKPEIEAHVRSLTLPFRPEVISTRTLSAAHSLTCALDALPGGEAAVALTVDTVFLATEFHRYVDAFEAMSEADVLMGVTRYADDEKPLYVETTASGRVRAFHDFANPAAEFVSAGIYGLNHRARRAIDRAMLMGVNGLREAQRSLLLQGVDVMAFEMSQVFDVDRPHDLLKAREFLLENER